MLVDHDVVEQPFDRTLSRPAYAFLNLVRLLRYVDVERRRWIESSEGVLNAAHHGRIHRTQRVERSSKPDVWAVVVLHVQRFQQRDEIVC